MTTGNMNEAATSETGKAQPSRASANGSADNGSYVFWVAVIMVLMAGMIGCVLLGQGMSAIAFAVVIHAAAYIQQKEADRD